ncbi:integrase catalytic domain-containing protein [Trichonephila clavipes]|nr:integrase catalytic domain-containing protein [Trichonephila clavipes]
MRCIQRRQTQDVMEQNRGTGSNHFQSAYSPKNKIVIENRCELREILSHYDSIFSKDKYDVGQLRVEPQRIILKSDLPVQLTPYPTIPIQEKEIKNQVEKLLQAGLIKESNSPYLAPVTLAFKRDEDLLFVLLPYQSPIDQNNYYEPVHEARELALQRTIVYIKNKIRYDARSIEKKINPGDLVVYEEFQNPNTRNLNSPISGPYEIIKQCSEVTYEIKKTNFFGKERFPNYPYF